MTLDSDGAARIPGNLLRIRSCGDERIAAEVVVLEGAEVERLSVCALGVKRNGVAKSTVAFGVVALNRIGVVLGREVLRSDVGVAAPAGKIELSGNGLIREAGARVVQAREVVGIRTGGNHRKRTDDRSDDDGLRSLLLHRARDFVGRHQGPASLVETTL